MIVKKIKNIDFFEEIKYETLKLVDTLKEKQISIQVNDQTNNGWDQSAG